MEWRRIQKWPRYEVSDEGQIRNSRSVKVLKLQIRRGYLSFTPTLPTKAYVGPTVLEAFVGPCPDRHECRHLDGVRANNAVTNLAWGTHQQNVDDTRRHGMLARGHRNAQTKLTEADVLEIRRLRSSMTLRQLGDRFHVSDTAVHTAATRQTWSHLA